MGGGGGDVERMTRKSSAYDQNGDSLGLLTQIDFKKLVQGHTEYC